MKKYILILLAAMLLVACSNKTATEDKEASATEQSEVETVQEETEEVEDNEVETEDDGKLTEVGQIIKDSDLKSTLELLEIKEVNETIDLDPIKLTIEDIKIIHLSDIKSADFKSYLSQFTDKEEFDYIQIMYKIENTEDENLDFYYPIEHVVLNTGEQIDTGMKDIMLHPDNGGEFFGEVTKNAGISLIIENSNVDEIESIKIITGDVWQKDGDRLVGEVEKTYNLK